jgi:hypothetical protein
MNIRPVGDELFHADRWTHLRDAANGRFSKFSNGPKMLFV